MFKPESLPKSKRLSEYVGVELRFGELLGFSTLVERRFVIKAVEVRRRLLQSRAKTMNAKLGIGQGGKEDWRQSQKRDQSCFYIGLAATVY